MLRTFTFNKCPLPKTKSFSYFNIERQEHKPSFEDLQFPFNIIQKFIYV